ncbi:MAG: beta-hydroxyacyl-ACP dehydratase [Zetaproteobacteria bacterium]|nr:beta-hydroxyacyl-ACP dehydratase [Pseudobdellovibrionaceae bacterium]|tara:strand:+ start:25 stop:498 length:474 start_codon:yes stop_codon:yes gene_type:complete
MINDWNDINEISDTLMELLPQKAPFRFLDRITEVDENHIIGQYRFKKDEFFYKGHFPERPLTPGVILVESMAQTGVVAFGFYLLLKEINSEEVKHNLTVFTEMEADFRREVLPGELITIKAEKMFFRRKKLKSKIDLYLENGELAASAILSGMGVPK